MEIPDNIATTVATRVKHKQAKAIEQGKAMSETGRKKYGRTGKKRLPSRPHR